MSLLQSEREGGRGIGTGMGGRGERIHVKVCGNRYQKSVI